MVGKRLVELLNVWKIEQERALKNGETVSKSAVAELILKMGINEYHKTHNVPKPLKSAAVRDGE